MALTTVSNSVGQDHNTRVDSSREAAQFAFRTAGEPPRILCVMSNRQQQTDPSKLRPEVFTEDDTSEN